MIKRVALLGSAAMVGLLALTAIAAMRLLPPPTSARAQILTSAPIGASPGGPELIPLTFRFRDQQERPREITCVIRRSDYERERSGFGIVEQQMRETVGRAKLEYVAKEVAKRGLARFFEIDVDGDGQVHWKYRYPSGTDPGVVKRIEAFRAWLEHDTPAAFRALTEEYYRERGFLLEGDTLIVDYEPLVRKASEPLADCFAALMHLESPNSHSLLSLFMALFQGTTVEETTAEKRPPLSLFMAFFQDLPREDLPNVEDGRETWGFRVPTAVMVKGAGDCDSKAAAFCALWRQIPGRALLILVPGHPGHALVAVEGKPRMDQVGVQLGNRYYILCEVGGPGRLRPGVTRISGSRKYIQIEPAPGGKSSPTPPST